MRLPYGAEIKLTRIVKGQSISSLQNNKEVGQGGVTLQLGIARQRTFCFVWLIISSRAESR